LSQQAGGPEQPPQGVLAAPRRGGSRGFAALFTLLAFSAGGYFGYQLNDGGEATPQREAGVTEVTTVAVTTVARAPRCQNPAAAVIAGRKAAPETKWPRHFDPLNEGVAVPAGKCLWVDWDATDAEVVQVHTAVGWVDLNVAEGWYLDDKLTCPAPGKTDIGPPA
jgi:hypothetical protein